MTLVVGSRTPCVGVAGTILSGGFSWVSAERGCISDPENMLDAEVVKHDDLVIWASSEPELLWSLCGGGSGFAGMYQHHISTFLQHDLIQYNRHTIHPPRLPVFPKHLGRSHPYLPDPTAPAHVRPCAVRIVERGRPQDHNAPIRGQEEASCVYRHRSGHAGCSCFRR